MKTFLRYLIYSCLLCCSLALANESPAIITAVHFAEMPAMSRLVITFNKKPSNYKVFSLVHPDRIVVDLTDTRLKVNVSRVQALPGIIAGLRNGFPATGVLRLVIDMKEAVPFKQTYLEQNTSLAIDFNKAVKQTAAIDFKKVVVHPTYSVPPKSIANLFSKKMPTMSLSKSAVAIPTVVTPAKKTVVIVIDPGHGGKDVGAKGVNGTYEKDVVLAISKQLAELLNQQPNRRAILTRKGDYFVPLRGRLQSARKGKADLFIAIHADSYFNTTASGASVYALSSTGATKEAVRWIAQRENYSELGSVDLKELSDQSYLLRSVLVDLAQTATITDSLRLGNSLLDSLNDVTRLHYARVEQAPFVVLKSPDIPSVLVELGFISNTKEEMLLRDPKYQKKLAQALMGGLQKYIKVLYPGSV